MGRVNESKLRKLAAARVRACHHSISWRGKEQLRTHDVGLYKSADIALGLLVVLPEVTFACTRSRAGRANDHAVHQSHEVPGLHVGPEGDQRAISNTC